MVEAKTLGGKMKKKKTGRINTHTKTYHDLDQEKW